MNRLSRIEKLKTYIEPTLSRYYTLDSYYDESSKHIHVDLKSNRHLVSDVIKNAKSALGWGGADYVSSGEGACTQFELWYNDDQYGMFLYDVYRKKIAFAIRGDDSEWQIQYIVPIGATSDEEIDR